MAVKLNLPSGKGEKYMGQIGPNEPFAKPFQAVDSGLPGMNSTKADIGEKSGFEGATSGYIVKKGTPYGEAAKFNLMPPGMDINDQTVRDIRDMPMKTVIAESYPGDGWSPTPRDLHEGYKSDGSAN